MKELLGLTPRPRIVTACCGAGWHLTSTLMGTPGASEYLVGSYLPYDAAETAKFLGFRPDKFVSEETALHLATEAFMRATLRSKLEERPIGLGMTASIASLKEHRGAHEAHTAVVADQSTYIVHDVFFKATGADARLANDRACQQSARSALFSVAHTDGGATRNWRDAFTSRPLFTPSDRGLATSIGPDAILFPGAFNPIHDTHKAIADAVFRSTGRPVIYAITADSPHKPALTFQEMARRAAQIRQEGAVLFTEGDPLYIDKARRFPGRAFIIGVDALERMLDPKWGPAVEPMLAEFAALGTTFYVAPRIVDGAPRKLRHLNDRLGWHAGIFKSIDIEPNALSSTQLRKEGQRDA